MHVFARAWHMHACVVCVHAFVCMHLCVCVCARACACVHACMCVVMGVHMSAHLNLLSKYVCTSENTQILCQPLGPKSAAPIIIIIKHCC